MVAGAGGGNYANQQIKFVKKLLEIILAMTFFVIAGYYTILLNYTDFVDLGLD